MMKCYSNGGVIMDLRDILTICFGIISVCSFGIVFMGCWEWKKAIRELDKQEETEIVKREVQKIIMRGSRFVIVGSILAFIFGLIATSLLNHII